MASIKLTGFIISMILFSLFIGIFGLYFSDLNENYTPKGYDNESIKTFNKLEELQSSAYAYKNESETISADRESLLKNIDPSGGMFSMAISSVQNIYKSFDTFYSMVDLATKEVNTYLGMGETVNYLKIALLSIVIILLIVGLLLPLILRVTKEL